MRIDKFRPERFGEHYLDDHCYGSLSKKGFIRDETGQSSILSDILSSEIETLQNYQLQRRAGTIREIICMPNSGKQINAQDFNSGSLVYVHSEKDSINRPYPQENLLILPSFLIFKKEQVIDYLFVRKVEKQNIFVSIGFSQQGDIEGYINYRSFKIGQTVQIGRYLHDQTLIQDGNNMYHVRDEFIQPYQLNLLG